jgi:monofunctional biosynthetic peptidoglycan transglycosylase
MDLDVKQDVEGIDKRWRRYCEEQVAAPFIFSDVPPRSFTLRKIPLKKGFIRSIIRWVIFGALILWLPPALILVAARWIDPPTTAVQAQRRMQSWFQNTTYQKRYQFVPMSQISPDLQHAVVAAEDARFYQHHGFDWHEIQIAAEENWDGERSRGASTLTQQLVKNLFFGTGRSFLRKGAELTLVRLPN